MPKQLITLEIDYPLLHEEDGEQYLRPAPQNWDFMGALDDHDYEEEVDGRTYTRTVRLVQASAVTYTEQDRAEAAEAETTLLELGVHE